MLILFKHHPNSTRTHRTPSKTNKGTNPTLLTNTPLLKIKNQCPHMLGSVIRQSNNATKHQPLKKHVPCNHHTPRTLISKTKDHAQNAAKDQSFTKNESLNPRRFAPRQISPRIRPKTTPKRMLKTHLFENHT